MSGQYRKQYYNKNHKKSNWMLWFYFLIVLVLLFAILITTGKKEQLQEYLSQKHNLESTKEEEVPEAVTPILTVRVVLLADDQQEYRSEVTIQNGVDGGITTYTKEQWPLPESKVIIADGDYPIYITDATGQKLSQGYEGNLELWNLEQGIVVVNEVSLETYLTSVLPSEMPQSYGLEALKAQAVCARSYAYVQARDMDYPLVMAQMDDSTSYQVYNKQPTNELANQAVQETANQILMKDEAVVETLYYSTSCGYTQDQELFAKDNASYLSSVYVGSSAPGEDFTSYITHGDDNAYEKDEKYFRWNTTMQPFTYQKEFVHLALQMNQEDNEDVVISKKLLKQMQNLQKAQQNVENQGVGEKLNAKKNKEREEAKELLSVSLGLRDIKCIRRNEGGAIEEMELSFDKGTMVITGELNIRKLLGSMMQTTTFQTGETVERNSQSPMLYSAAFVWNEVEDGTWQLLGGGFGHGCGMSQNGAKHLAEQGSSYQEILHFFYKDVTIQEMV